jgi:SHS family lactate transporter-like MFS transporter
LFVFATDTTALLAGAAIVGAFGTGNFGIVPGYLSERFPTDVRAGGAGFAYHVGAALAAVAPSFVGRLVDDGTPLAQAMAGSIVVSGALVIVIMWLGPETRGRALVAAPHVKRPAT